MCKYTPNRQVIESELSIGRLQPGNSACSTRGVGSRLWVVLWATACFAQPYEVGATIGYGAYRNATVIAPAGKAEAGFGNRFAAGAILGEDLYRHLSGELRYLFQDGDPFVSAGGKKGNVQGQSHAVHYDLLFHLNGRESRWRPYAAVGGGIKYFRTTGPAPSPQPLPSIVTLTNENQIRWLVTAGGGVKYRLYKHVSVRGEFLDYITPFPHRLFVPAQGGTDRGIFQQFTPMFGIGYTF
ncbi:MAG: hypothetical protein C5B51_32070 [Terriglobia bacterium]|nr:MAG: hypothetical protein C5B51_32070 [Terriglobia bacterium]